MNSAEVVQQKKIGENYREAFQASFFLSRFTQGVALGCYLFALSGRLAPSPAGCSWKTLDPFSTVGSIVKIKPRTNLVKLAHPPAVGRIIPERNPAKPFGVRAACRRPASAGWSKLQHSEGAFGTGPSFLLGFRPGRGGQSHTVETITSWGALSTGWKTFCVKPAAWNMASYSAKV